MKLNFELQLPEAIWWPDIFGDGYEDDILEVIKSGNNAVFLYFEDYLNYTAILNGKYIISGFQNGVKIGDWLVDINVFGTISNVKAIACTFIQKVEILSEIDLIGPDGLDVKKCFYEKTNIKKLA
jgi:hypothetical protein